MKTSAAILALLQTAPDDGSAFGRILSNLPTDPASIFTLVLMIAAVAAVIWFGRPKGDKHKPSR